jgi:hypothetical protein
MRKSVYNQFGSGYIRGTTNDEAYANNIFEVTDDEQAAAAGTGDRL